MLWEVLRRGTSARCGLTPCAGGDVVCALVPLNRADCPTTIDGGKIYTRSHADGEVFLMSHYSRKAPTFGS